MTALDQKPLYLNTGGKTKAQTGDGKMAAKESLADQKSRFTTMTHAHSPHTEQFVRTTPFEFSFKGTETSSSCHPPPSA